MGNKDIEKRLLSLAQDYEIAEYGCEQGKLWARIWRPLVSKKYFSTASKACNTSACDTPVAYYYLGYCFGKGIGTTKDISKSIENYKKAYDNGLSNSAIPVFIYYLNRLRGNRFDSEACDFLNNHIEEVSNVLVNNDKTALVSCIRNIIESDELIGLIRKTYDIVVKIDNNLLDLCVSDKQQTEILNSIFDEISDLPNEREKFCKKLKEYIDNKESWADIVDEKMRYNLESYVDIVIDKLENKLEYHKNGLDEISGKLKENYQGIDTKISEYLFCMLASAEYSFHHHNKSNEYDYSGIIIMYSKFVEIVAKEIFLKRYKCWHLENYKNPLPNYFYRDNNRERNVLKDRYNFVDVESMLNDNSISKERNQYFQQTTGDGLNKTTKKRLLELLQNFRCSRNRFVHEVRAGYKDVEEMAEAAHELIKILLSLISTKIDYER